MTSGRQIIDPDVVRAMDTPPTVREIAERFGTTYHTAYEAVQRWDLPTRRDHNNGSQPNRVRQHRPPIWFVELRDDRPPVARLSLGDDALPECRITDSGTRRWWGRAQGERDAIRRAQGHWP